jgi:signal transduction histidine kinase
MTVTPYTMRRHLAQMLIVTVVSIALSVPGITYAITKIQLESHFRRQALRASLIAARQGVFSFLGAPADVASADAAKLRDLTGAEYLEFIDAQTSMTIVNSGDPQPSIDRPSTHTALTYTAPTLIRETSKAWYIAVPVLPTARTGAQNRAVDDPPPTPIGLLYIRYSKDAVAQLVLTVTIIAGIISACIMVVAIVWGRRRLRALIDPLDALARVMLHADAGERAAHHGPQEIVTIAAVYNRLMDRIDRQRDDLEATVSARTAALEKALDAAQQAERFKTALLSNSTHEMKTPLHLIDAAVRRSMHELEFLPGTAGIREALRTILRASAELLSRIEKILRNARIQGDLHQLTPSILHTPDFMARLSDRFSPLATNHGNTLHLDASGATSTTVDHEKLFEVACELVMNSCKFTHGGNIYVQIDVAGRVDLKVTDDGSGIVLEEQPLIWDEFYQGKPIGDHPPNFPGQGLGLAMVKRLVSQMRGTITLDSTIGRGTTVLVSIPSLAPALHVSTPA